MATTHWNFKDTKINSYIQWLYNCYVITSTCMTKTISICTSNKFCATVPSNLYSDELYQRIVFGYTMPAETSILSNRHLMVIVFSCAQILWLLLWIVGQWHILGFLHNHLFNLLLLQRCFCFAASLADLQTFNFQRYRSHLIHLI